jgi:hypothetical protein
VLQGANVEISGGHGALVLEGLPVEVTALRDHGGLYLVAKGRRAPLHVTWLSDGSARVKVGAATVTLTRSR